MEMRGADGGPWRRLCALPAFWVGLLYDRGALDAAWDLVRDWTAEDREGLRHDAAKFGLRAEFRGRSLRDVARDVLAIAEAGLRARARPGAGGTIPDETHFLNALAGERRHRADARGRVAGEVPRGMGRRSHADLRGLQLLRHDSGLVFAFVDACLTVS